LAVIVLHSIEIWHTYCSFQTFDQELQDLAVMDFKKAICSQIKDPVTQAVPDACLSFAPRDIPALAIIISAVALLVYA
jgi:hypothetical protein